MGPLKINIVANLIGQSLSSVWFNMYEHGLYFSGGFCDERLPVFHSSDTICAALPPCLTLHHQVPYTTSCDRCHLQSLCSSVTCGYRDLFHPPAPTPTLM